MNILIVAYYFPPTNGAGSLRPYYWAKYWSESGHNITVLTRCNSGSLELPELPAVEIISLPHFDVYSVFRRKKKTTVDTIVSEQSKRRTSLLKKLILFFQRKTGILSSVRMPEPADFWFFPAKKWLMNSNKKWDFVISTCGPYVTHCVGYKAKVLNKTNFWVADYRDLWSHNELFKGLFPFSLLEKYMESVILSKVDLLSVVTLYQQTVLKNKIHTSPILSLNGLDMERYIAIPETKKNTDTFLICYTGTLYPEFQDIVPFFSALQHIKENHPNIYEKIDCRFIGTGIDEYIIQKAEQFAISDCINCSKYLSYSDAVGLQKSSDLLIYFDIFNPKTNTSVHALPTKLIEYLASGSSIVYIGNTQTSERATLLSPFKGIYEVDNNKNKIISLFLDKMSFLTQKHLRSLEFFSRKKLSATLLQRIQEVINNNNLL